MILHSLWLPQCRAPSARARVDAPNTAARRPATPTHIPLPSSSVSCTASARAGLPPLRHGAGLGVSAPNTHARRPATPTHIPLPSWQRVLQRTPSPPPSAAPWVRDGGGRAGRCRHQEYPSLTRNIILIYNQSKNLSKNKKIFLCAGFRKDSSNFEE
jgi:hypothetical protein